MANEFKRQQVGSIQNYYGGLWVAKQGDKYFWCIENYNTELDDPEEYQEISKELYDALLTFEGMEPKQELKQEPEYREFSIDVGGKICVGVRCKDSKISLMGAVDGAGNSIRNQVVITDET